MEQSFVGIDVCKKRLEVAVRGGDIAKPAFHVTNTEGGCKSLVDKLTGHSVAKVVLEATGGYERKAWGCLARGWHSGHGVEPPASTSLCSIQREAVEDR